MTTFKRLLLLVPLFLLLVLSASASAAPAGPGFIIDSFPSPTDFSEGAGVYCSFNGIQACGDNYDVVVTNAGSEATNGEPIVLSDVLPQGVSLAGGGSLYLESGYGNEGPNREVYERVGECGVVGAQARCTYAGALAPDAKLRWDGPVSVNEATTPPGTRLLNRATVSGGGATPVSAESSNEVNPAPAPFGVSGFGFYKAGLNGAPETQAGGHPYELVTTIDLDNAWEGIPGNKSAAGSEPASPEDVKDVVVDLPLGFAGSTLAAPECAEAQLGSANGCPPDTTVGRLDTEPIADNTKTNGPIWNMVPERGFPAGFGYRDLLKGAHTFYVHVVPTSEGYVLQTVAYDVPEIPLDRIMVTFYGDPAAKDQTTDPQVPFFTNPTACSGANQVAKIWIDSWNHPGRIEPGGYPADLGEPQWKKAESVTPPVIGCNALQFTPEIGSQPTTHQADSPSGLEFEQRLPQTETPGVPATPALKDTTIVFPAGMTVDPSSADGLGTCSLAQIGWQGHAPAQPGELYDFTENKPECPESSKIGTLELETPLIPGKLYGEVFLAAQNENPFHSTFATYIVVNDPVTGVVLKLAGEVKLCASAGETIDGKSCEAPGQITATFDETPQLPFSDLKVHFFGGPRSEFATPSNCGIYTTNSELTPWSAPGSGLPPTPFDNYVIDENCAIGFAPSFAALTANVQAGEYTPFEGSFSREDDDQELAGLTMNLPPGLLANVPSVTECGEAELKAEEADAPTGGCPASSQVGTVTAEAGPGPNPLSVPGKVFFTGPHNGGPYGLAVVVSANPGPFHFGNVLVRQSLRINPYTAAVTDVSDPFPTFIHPVGANGQTNGIPIKLRRVDFDIDRPGFTFNPTNCNKLAVSGAISSTQGAVSNQSVPFQVTNCQNLKFEPKISFSTNGKTSKADGADLITKVTYPHGPQGTYADVGYVKVELPKALPSRLTTLQKACTLAQFDANPAGCPSASDIGHVTVKTPILPGVLSGPAIFVSHGGEAFPTLTMVLQGDGVTIDLVGNTFISKAGVTSTTFKTVPDSPFETFELVLPQGPYSALAANGNLCTQQLVIPNEWNAQDGTPLKEDSVVNVTGCKPAIYVTKHSVKGRTATISVKVPSAGHLTASARGLIAPSGAGKATKSTSSTTGTTLTVKLHLTNGEVAFINKARKANKTRHLIVKVNLTFTQKHGGKLKTTTTVNIG
jgi:hypothetical protein